MQDNNNNSYEEVTSEYSPQEPTTTETSESSPVEIEPKADEITSVETFSPEVESEVQAVQSNLDAIEEPVAPYELTALVDGGSFETFSSSARTVQEFVKERGMEPEMAEVQSASTGGFVSMDSQIDPDDIYTVISRNKTGGYYNIL